MLRWARTVDAVRSGHQTQLAGRHDEQAARRAVRSDPSGDIYAIDAPAASGGTPPSTIHHLLAHAPSVSEPVVSLGAAVLSRLELPDDLRVLVTLSVAQELDSPYVKAQCVRAARDQGIDPAKAEAAHHGRATTTGSPEVERIVLDFTREVLRCGEPSSNTFAALRPLFSERQVIELLVAIGHDALICRIATTRRLDPHEWCTT